LIDSINNYVTVNDVNGTVTLNNINGSTLVNVTNGLIKSRQAIPINGAASLTTVNGNISLDIPKSTSSDLSANMTNGTFNSFNLDFKNQVISHYSVRATLGNGQGKIVLNTVNGNISVSGY
jgi:DUF4097 and DUF4098 domain-containing protein YvlB